MRPAGLPSIASIASPAHIVHVFEHGKELLEISAQFCRAGLEAGECCLWITTPPWTAAIALHELTLLHLPDAFRYVETGQLQFVAYDEWYLTANRFDPDAILKKMAPRIEQAYQQGWPRVRACGKPCRPGIEPDWMNLLRYERLLHEQLLAHDLLVLCSYRVSGIRATVKTELLEAHDAMLQRDHHGWHYTPREADRSSAEQ